MPQTRITLTTLGMSTPEHKKSSSAYFRGNTEIKNMMPKSQNTETGKALRLNQLLLASQSPRRREMVTWLNLPVQTTQADVNETRQPTESPVEMATRLARLKSRTGQEKPGDWILAADTVVDFEGIALGKPQSPQEARTILKTLRGQVHFVHTGVALRIADFDHEASCNVTTRVWMRSYSDAEIDDYVGGGDPLDKAGAYAIQHSGFAPVERLDRCYANVVGLPLCAVVALLEAQGIVLQVQIPQLCLDHFGYHCPRSDRGASL